RISSHPPRVRASRSPATRPGGRTATPSPPDGRTRSDDLRLVESALREPGENRLPVRAVVVPGKRDLADQVGVRCLEAVEVAERRAQAHHAALAADALDLDRLRSKRHESTTSLASAPRRPA